MSTPTMSIRRAVAQAYGDFQSAADAMPALAIMALVLNIMFDAVIELQLPLATGDSMALPLAIFLIGLAQTAMLTPYVIAVHRFIILGEAATGYVLAPGEPRNQLYFLWWALLAALTIAPVFLLALPQWLDSAERVAELLLAMLVYYGLLLFGALRLVVLFPAIAVGAPGARWRNAVADTKGHGRRVLLICFVAFLPAMLAGGLAQWLGGLNPSMVYALVLSVLEGIVAFVIVTLYAVISSRLYLALADKVKTSA